MKTFIAKHHRKTLNMLCCIAFCWQLYGILGDWIHPSQKTTDISEDQLKDLTFPITFKVCMKPGFNTTALKEEGYASISEYFFGQSRFNNSLYGWAGHTNTSDTRDTLEDVYQRVQCYPRIEDAISW